MFTLLVHLECGSFDFFSGNKMANGWVTAQLVILDVTASF